MKKIAYKYCVEVNVGTEENPEFVQSLYSKTVLSPDDVFEANLAIAQREAYNGEYTVEDVEDPITEPSQLDQIEAQVTYTAMMTDTLLEE